LYIFITKLALLNTRVSFSIYIHPSFSESAFRGEERISIQRRRKNQHSEEKKESASRGEERISIERMMRSFS
tara:strand:+ start:320 stop:535 length:216 start_codon:yes stop_codon:yes gene_type:complete